MDDSMHFLHIFISLIWHSVTWMFKILNWNLAISETQIHFRGLCSTHGIIIKDFLTSFHNPEKLFSEGQTKLYANSLFLNDSQQSQNTIKTHIHTYTLNINYTKSHHSLTVTLSTLIHNKSTQQSEAVYPVSIPHGQLGSTWLTTHILRNMGKWEKTNLFLGVHRWWETWTTNTTWEKHEWEQMVLLRTTVNGKWEEVFIREEETIPSLAIICFLSFRQQTQGFHTLLRDRFASISMLLWHSLSALLLYESVVCPCTQLSWSGYWMTQESAVFQNDNLLQLVNWMWQCCSLGLVMMELLNEQHHHIEMNQPGKPAITEHSNDLHHCILTKQSICTDKLWK